MSKHEHWKTASRNSSRDSQLRHAHSQCAQFRGVLPRSRCVPEMVFILDSASRTARKLREEHTLPHQDGDWSCSHCVESLCVVNRRVAWNGRAFIQISVGEDTKESTFIALLLSCAFPKVWKGTGKGGCYK